MFSVVIRLSLEQALSYHITVTSHEYHSQAQSFVYRHISFKWVAIIALCSVFYQIAVNFIHILRGYFTGIGSIMRLPQCPWSNTEEYGLMNCMLSHELRWRQKVQSVWDILDLISSHVLPLQLAIMDMPTYAETEYFYINLSQTYRDYYDPEGLVSNDSVVWRYARPGGISLPQNLKWTWFQLCRHWRHRRLS